MTRRKFVQKLLKTGSAVVIGVSWLAKKAVPRKFVWAVKTKKYPGRLKPLRDISKQSKWSG
ncbi:MAG: hypothetical protein ACYSTG_03920 [Planctomycetota bacterium]